MRVLIFTLCLFAFPLAAQPTPVLQALQNGASYSSDIAAGSIFVLRGENLSEDGFIQAAGLPLETSLNGVSIRFSPLSGGAPLDARMIYLYNAGGVNQLAGLLPSSAAPGAYDVVVTRNSHESAALRVNVVGHSPGIVSADSSGSGPAQATTANYELVRFVEAELGGFGLRPVHPGEAVVLWMTGLGADVESDFAGGSSGDRTEADGVRVLVNGVEVVPFYAGRASGLPGTDQVNFIVPADVRLSCSVSVQVRAGGVLSNRVTIAVAAPGQTACAGSDLTVEELRTLSLGGTVRRGVFDIQNMLIENVFPGMPATTAFNRTFYGGVVDYTQNDVVAEGRALTPGQCIVWTRTGPAYNPLFGVVTYLGLDAGPTIAVSGPGVGPIQAGKLTDRTSVEYFATMDAVPSGVYAMRAPGGADVGAFEASADLPDFDWTDRESTQAITRSGMTLHWTGGGSGWVNITGNSARAIRGDPRVDVDAIVEAALFSCVIEASAGAMTIPASILAPLPAVGEGSATTGSLAVIAIPGPSRTEFQAPLTAGGTVTGHFGYSIGFTKILAVE